MLAGVGELVAQEMNHLGTYRVNLMHSYVHRPIVHRNPL
jgi:hypothetical protein